MKPVSSCFLSSTSMILGGAYSLWLFNRIAYGNIKIEFFSTYSDLNLKEFFYLGLLSFFVIFVGIYPEIFLISLNTLPCVFFN